MSLVPIRFTRQQVADDVETGDDPRNERPEEQEEQDAFRVVAHVEFVCAESAEK